ncbi:MAG TPA: IS30 family transposase [Candidatus Nanoperiomorbaceae bacterium]|nr:IS30 family transposase [Candidatus Nanoperiomorbaceae bacterium]
MKKAPKISDAERSEIAILHSKGYSARSIATALGRSPNTIAAELRRNSRKDGTYVADQAKQKAYVRRKYAKYQGKKIQENDELHSFIILKLTEHWNPDEIAGYLKHNPELGFYASKTAIYEWLRSVWGQQYCSLLYCKRYNRKPRRQNKTDRGMIPDRTSITERPVAALDRIQAGHYEYDSVVSSKRSGSTAALAVLTERSSRLVQARLVPDLKPEPYAKVILRLSQGLKSRSMTTDNGIENRQHKLITKSMGTPVYFTDPYSSWQKGGVENANKMLRRYFPKGTDFAKVKQTDVVHALTLINNKPRKILGYKSSLQVAREKGLILDEGVLIGG